MSEVAVMLGFISGGLFNDFTKFCDTIDIPTLIDNARETNFPIPELALILFQHAATRVVQHASACSFPVQVFRSILAGCAHSVALTRAMLRDVVDKYFCFKAAGPP